MKVGETIHVPPPPLAQKVNEIKGEHDGQARVEDIHGNIYIGRVTGTNPHDTRVHMEDIANVTKTKRKTTIKGGITKVIRPRNPRAEIKTIGITRTLVEVQGPTAVHPLTMDHKTAVEKAKQEMQELQDQWHREALERKKQEHHERQNRRRRRLEQRRAEIEEELASLEDQDTPHDP